MAAHSDFSPRHPPPPPIAMEASHGAHVFEVTPYSRHRDLCFAAFLRSSPFRVGGCDWAIRFYPGGCWSMADSLVHAAVGLELLTRDAVATVSFGAGLVDEDTGARYSPATESVEAAFDTRCVEGFCKCWILSRFMTRSELEASPFLRGDCVVIELALRVIEGTRPPPPEVRPPEVTVPPSDMADHMGRMLDGGEGADVTFDIRGESIPAHRNVVASRSPVFKAELHGEMKEGSQGRIAIGDMQPAVFRALLRFIYPDSLPAMDGISNDDDRLEMTRHLLVAADRYAMDRLKLACARILSETLDMESVATTLGLADRHCCSALKDMCIQFIVSSNRMHDVSRTRGFASLKTCCPFVLVEVLEMAGKCHKI